MTNGNNTGVELENRVKLWAYKKFKVTDSATRYFVNGLSVTKPFEVDVWIKIPTGLFGWSTTNVWIECKDRKASIKRGDVFNLVSKAKDVYQAVRKGKQDLYFDKLMIVTTSRYDTDAIALANQEGVACYLYDGGKYLLFNDWDWDNEPKWLRDVKTAS